MNGSGKFYGKYRGIVVNNVDPMQLGRLLVQVPEVSSISQWAEPCAPLAGPPGPPMGVYLVPPVGTGVWVEFEKGDPDHPICVGCRWGGQSGIPIQAWAGLPTSPSIVLQTLGQNSIVISDVTGAKGGIMLKTPSGAMISISESSIIISNGQGAIIALDGPSVGINNGALKVP
jgi:uncharacterized protein involved in type VI secretion and phage assembly